MNPSVPGHFNADVARLPPALRALLEVELAAGNEIAEVIHGFPVAPVGVGIRLVRPLSPARTAETRGIKPRRFPNWDGSSGYSDEVGHSFLLGPPRAPPEAPGGDELPVAAPRPATGASEAVPVTPLARFEKSFCINYGQWHDGIGLDLEAIREASPAERAAMEARLLQQGVRDWRVVEALAVLDTPGARAALERAKKAGNQEVAMALSRYAPQLLSETERTALIVGALERANFFGGLTEALDQAVTNHSPAVVEALLRGSLERDGEVAVHFAALLMFLHGKAASPFDWAQRPFFLRFRTNDRAERREAFLALCRTLGVDPTPQLAGS